MDMYFHHCNGYRHGFVFLTRICMESFMDMDLYSHILAMSISEGHSVQVFVRICVSPYRVLYGIICNTSIVPSKVIHVMGNTKGFCTKELVTDNHHYSSFCLS
jgi:hypothetical protein